MELRAYVDGNEGTQPHRVMVIVLSMSELKDNSVSAAIFDGNTRQPLLMHTPETDHASAAGAIEKVREAARDFFEDWRGGYLKHDGHMSPWDWDQLKGWKPSGPEDDDVPY